MSLLSELDQFSCFLDSGRNVTMRPRLPRLTRILRILPAGLARYGVDGRSSAESVHGREHPRTTVPRAASLHLPVTGWEPTTAAVRDATGGGHRTTAARATA